MLSVPDPAGGYLPSLQIEDGAPASALGRRGGGRWGRERVRAREGRRRRRALARPGADVELSPPEPRRWSSGAAGVVARDVVSAGAAPGLALPLPGGALAGRGRPGGSAGRRSRVVPCRCLLAEPGRRLPGLEAARPTRRRRGPLVHAGDVAAAVALERRGPAPGHSRGGTRLPPCSGC